MNKRLIISGATRGIGKAIAQKFASGGFDIAFCSRTPSDVSAFENHLKEKYNVRAAGFVADLSIPAKAKQFGLDALGFLGGCDVLVNNTGIYMPGSIEFESDETFTLQMAVNLGSAYFLTKVIIPELKKGSRPHLFNMCSIASITAYPNGASYCISKFALLGFTRVLREELKHNGVAVTAVMPGATLTESWGETEEPSTRFIRPADIAESIWSALQINEHSVVEDLVIRPLAGDI
jgi:short-subunit dehydrogenase